MHLACCITVLLQCWWQRSKVMKVNESPAVMINTFMCIYIWSPNSFFFAHFTSAVLHQTCQLSICLGLAAVPCNQCLLPCCLSVFKIWSQAVLGYPDRPGGIFPKSVGFFSYTHPGKSPRKCAVTGTWMLIDRIFCLSHSRLTNQIWLPVGNSTKLPIDACHNPVASELNLSCSFCLFLLKRCYNFKINVQDFKLEISQKSRRIASCIGSSLLARPRQLAAQF